MPILKSEIRNKFSTIPNSIIRAKDLTDAEYRLLIYLYSLPDGWKINQSYLGKELNCNRININKKISRLKQLGYLEVNKSSSDKSTDYIYVLKEKGVSSSDVSLGDVSLGDVSVSDTHINTNIINTNIINKEYIYNLFTNYINNNMSSIELEKLNNYIEVFKGDLRIIEYAIEYCKMNKVYHINYLCKILYNWEKAGFKTLEDIKENEKLRAKEKEERKNVELFSYDWLNDEED